MALIARGVAHPGYKKVRIDVCLKANTNTWFVFDEQTGLLEIHDTSPSVANVTKTFNSFDVEKIEMIYYDWDIVEWRPSQPFMSNQYTTYAIEHMSEGDLVSLMRLDDQWEEVYKRTTTEYAGRVWSHKFNIHDSFAFSDCAKMKAWLKLRLKQTKNHMQSKYYTEKRKPVTI